MKPAERNSATSTMSNDKNDNAPMSGVWMASRPPTITPSNAVIMTSATIWRWMLDREAPVALRSPISRVLRVTFCHMTPISPRTTIARRNPPTIPMTARGTSFPFSFDSRETASGLTAKVQVRATLCSRSMNGSSKSAVVPG